MSNERTPARRIMGSAVDMQRKPETQSMAQLLNELAARLGKTTILQQHGDSTLVWVTKDEVDPLRGMLSAALTIMAKRGMPTEGMRGVSIRKATVAAPGANVFWQVTENDGAVVASGYAATEQAAADEVRKYMTLEADDTPQSSG